MDFTTIIFLVLLFYSFQEIHSIEEPPPKRPTFPDVFTVEVEAVFKVRQVEADATVYYDKTKNRAAINTFYQKNNMWQIYRFDDNVMLTIEGSGCKVEKIDDDPSISFFPFVIDMKTKKKTIASAEDFLHFTNATFDSGSSSEDMPMYIYKSVMDVPMYQRRDCDVTHIFTKPQVEMPDCDYQGCRSTIVAISVECPTYDDRPFVDHLYRFFRYKSFIDNESPFEVPEGIYCNVPNSIPLPSFPKYFSFSYDVTEKLLGSESPSSTRINHKSIWYDEDNQLLRIEHYDDNGYSTLRKICDFKNSVGYAIMTTDNSCSSALEIADDFSFSDISQLPDLLLPLKYNNTDGNVVYSGKRLSNGMEYDVWSMQTTVDSTLTVVKDIYFSQAPYTEGEKQMSQLQIMQIVEYIYAEDDDTRENKLIQTTHIAVSKFKSVPDMTVFDTTACKELSKSFTIVFPSQSKDSLRFGERSSERYSKFLHALYKKLIEASGGVSPSRIGQPKVILKSSSLIVTSVILEDPVKGGFNKGVNSTEPDMNKAFSNIKNYMNKGLFMFNISVDEEVTKTLHFETTDLQETYNEDIEGNDEELGYTRGAMAGLGVVMALIGVLIGSVALFVYLKSKSAGNGLQHRLVN